MSYSVASAQSAPVNLDLTSSTANVSVSGAISGPVIIDKGGTPTTVDSNSVVTPAEFVAAVQVATTAQQTLTVAGDGTASGGSFVASSLSQLTGLVIPTGVTAIHDFGSNATLNLSGNLVNSGTLYAVSTNNQITNATFYANTITNQTGGLFTSVLPTGGLAGFSNLVSNLTLTLNAVTNIINYGTISSAGSLNLTAGNSIINTINPAIAGNAAVANATATLQAANAVTMMAANIMNQGQIQSIMNNLNVNTNNLTNTGLMQAMQGSINVQSLVGNTLNVLNNSGIISARDSVLFSVGGNSTANILNVTGGSILGNDFTFDAGLGRIAVDVANLSNAVSVVGRDINVNVTAGTNGLNIDGLENATSGSLGYTGTGNVDFRTFDTNGGAIRVNTTGNVTVLGPGNSPNPGRLDTTSTSGSGAVSLVTSGGNIRLSDVTTNGTGSINGADITLIAGQNISAGNLNASAAAGANPGNITVRAGLTGVGTVDMGGADVSAGSNSAGNVTITAPGSVTVNGGITAPNGTITLGGSSTNISGTVNVGQGSVNWEVPDTGSYIVDFAQLIRYGGSTVSVGGQTGFSSDIILRSDCNGCLGSVGSVSFNTSGRYIATGTTLTLGDNTALRVTADGGINTGSARAGSISFNSQGLVTVDGNLSSDSSIGLTGGDITVNSGRTLTADAGNLWLNAANDITLQQGVTIASYATADGSTGGRIGIMAGAPNTDMNALLSSMAASRTGDELLTVSSGYAFDSSNVINSTGGSLMQVAFAPNAPKSVTNSTFNLTGGIVFLDPPGTNNVDITGATFIAVGPQLQPLPGGGGGTGGTGGIGGTGTTGGTGGIGGTAGGGTIGVGTGGTNVDSVTGSSILSSINLFNTTGATSNVSLSNQSTNGTGSTNITVTTNSNVNTNNNTNTVPSLELNSSASATTNANNNNPNNSNLHAAIYCAPPGKLQERDTLDGDDAWIIASNKCQPFSFETADGSIVIGTGPAIFAPTANRTLLLKEGKLLVIAGESMIVVRTPMCNVTIPANSASTVEFSKAGLTRLTGLAGGKASVSVTRQGETIILTAGGGEQLVLAEDAIPDSQMQCEPDVPNQKLTSWLVRIPGLRGEKFTFDRTEMVSREGLLNCTLGCFTKIQQSMIDQIRKSMLMETPRELKSLLPARQRSLISKANSNKNHLTAVGFGDVLDLTVPELTALKCSSALVKFAAGTNISIAGPNVLQLRSGDALVSTSNATTVKAGRYTIKLAPSTVALVSNHGDHVTVRNIYETKLTSVQVLTDDKRTVGAQVGQEVILGGPEMSYTHVLNEEAVGRRRMHHSDLGSTNSLISSEVSMVSLLQNTNILSQLCRSEHPDDKAIVSKVMKTAVALQIATQRHGNYSFSGQ